MNGLDFLKSCTTNVRSIENLFDTSFTLYESTQRLEQENRIHTAVADLRDRNILCAAAKDELWVFGPLGGDDCENIDADKYDITQYDVGVKFESDRRTRNGTLLVDALLGAIEGSISFSLAKGHGIVHIGYFAWLFVPPNCYEDTVPSSNILVRLNVNMTDSGTLYISTTTTASDFQPLHNPESQISADLLLAPSGLKAKLAVESEGDNTTLAAPLTAMHFTSGWIPTVYAALTAEGTDMDSENEWLVIEIVENGKEHRILWPQKLCFASGFDSKMLNGGSSDRDWKYWFESSPDGFRSPFAEAEEWVVGATERETLLNASSDDNGVTADGGTSSTVVAETPLATSPPFNQRLMDQHAALSGIYPTPPDGLMPANATQLPTSDGVGGSVQVEQRGLGAELQLTNSDDTQVGRDSIGSNGDQQTYQPNSDDLFGDLGEMDFGANEVGDADFDYFDEPDELPQDANADPDVEMAVDNSSPHEKEDTNSKPQVDIFDEQEGMVLEEATVPDSRPPSSHDLPRDPPAPGPSHDQPTVPTQPQPSPVISSPASTTKEPEKPLSPWGIRRQLFPMIPASAVSADATQSQSSRRNSTFDPITFNENLDLFSKYANSRQVDVGTDDRSQSSNVPSIALPQKRKRIRSKSAHALDSGTTDTDSSSEDDSDVSTTSVSDNETMPPRLPWDTKKRKRSSWQEQTTPSTATGDNMWGFEDNAQSAAVQLDPGNMTDMLEIILNSRSHVSANNAKTSIRPNQATADIRLPSIEDLFAFTKQDLTYLAQILGEQSLSPISRLQSSSQSKPATSLDTTTSSLESILTKTTTAHLPTATQASIQKLAVLRESPIPRPLMNPAQKTQQGAPAARREGSLQPLPDLFPLLPPYLRVMRGTETWELLPPALSFWNALSLGPVSGGKNVLPLGIVAGNEGLVGATGEFLREVGGVYEGMRLGSFGRGSQFEEALNGLAGWRGAEGCVAFQPELEGLEVEGVLRGLGEVCEDIGACLAGLPGLDAERTVVIFLVDPFEDARITPYLTACFWKLCKTYRQQVPKTAVKGAGKSDLQFQLLPASLLASAENPVPYSADDLDALAHQIYSSCPPSPKAMAAMDTPSALPIFAAPAVELAPTGPKRIAFQLVPDPPADLMNEGSVLHLAYALSTDKRWLAVCWVDSTARYQHFMSFSLLGRPFTAVLTEVWERTTLILSAREVTWRVFIVRPRPMEGWEARCWRRVVARRGRATIHISLLSLDKDPALQLSPPSTTENGPGAGFLTPGSTPLGVSPDATAAPPTPAPTDSAAENDPDAQLVDLRDECWGVLLTPSYTASPSTVANGLLLRRGEDGGRKLEGLGVRLHWDIRVRASGAVDEGPARQGDVTLREVLRLFRGLGVVGRVRGLDGGRGLVPVHVGIVERVVKGLGWFRV